ncbi:MAG: peptide chain release factor N(5)-glutamine methyltransferase [Candidatus Aminicenantes bacterium]|nr:peptide chain release factor N(5)-glutamine methyltransferase [Candidatus Aminicenantes bacterium]
MPLVENLIEEGRRILSDMPQARREAHILLTASTHLSEAELFAHPEKKISTGQAIRFRHMLNQRRKNKPLAYIIGRSEFWSLSFQVNKNVLIPRPETECLVEKALSVLPENPGILADIGTGCGNLAVVLALERPQAVIYATDISMKALRTAKQNARCLGAEHIKFQKGRLFEPLDRLHPKILFDLIISNPPYVSYSDWHNLPDEVRNHEPRSALLAGTSGTEILEKLIKGCPLYLKKGGRVLFEIGYGQEKKIQALFGKEWNNVSIHPDYKGIPRIVSAVL